MTPPSENPTNSDTPPSMVELREGRYAITGTLGAGSQGETLEAVDKREGRPVAIKRFTIRGAKSWKDVELAEREARVLSSLSHPALPRYIEHFEEGGALYLVMEKIEGETLATRRRRGARLEREQVLRFLEEAGACLAYLHSQAPPVVHRDIKPGNVIRRPDGSYCIVDFGSVRDRLKPEGGSTVVGTFGFMAPEQFQGRAAAGSDVYAVAATALSLLTGQEPEDLPHKGLAVDVDTALRGQSDRRLIAALREMLEPDPDRRASSVHEALVRAGLRSTAQTPHATSAQAAPETPAQAAKRARRARLDAQSWRYEAEVEAEHWRSEAEAWLGDWQKHGRKHQSKAERRAQREAERAERKARRKAERKARHTADQVPAPPGPPVPPGIVLGMALLLALRVATVATVALFQVLLPLMFTLLSVIAGPGMHERRERMREIGRRGQTGLSRARQHVRHQFLGGPQPRELRDTSTPTHRRTRIEEEVGPTLGDEIVEAPAELEAELKTHRRER